MYLLFLKPQECLAQELNLCRSNLERNKFPLRGNHIKGTISCGGETGEGFWGSQGASLYEQGLGNCCSPRLCGGAELRGWEPTKGKTKFAEDQIGSLRGERTSCLLRAQAILLRAVRTWTEYTLLCLCAVALDPYFATLIKGMAGKALDLELRQTSCTVHKSDGHESCQKFPFISEEIST